MPNTTAASRTGATALRPVTYAGVAAAVVSIAAMIAIVMVPRAESVVTVVHLLVNILLFATAGALAARFGVAGWRAGFFAGLLDAMIGHTVAFLLSSPPAASEVTAPPGRVLTPELLASMHVWGAVLGAIVSVLIAIAAGAAGGRYARRTPAGR